MRRSFFKHADEKRGVSEQKNRGHVRTINFFFRFSVQIYKGAEFHHQSIQFPHISLVLVIFGVLYNNNNRNCSQKFMRMI